MDSMDELGGGKTLQGCWSRKIAAGMCEQASDVDDLEHVFNDTSAEPIKISYAVLKSITKNFGQVIGRGGFGVVYLGELRSGMVAVKKLSTPIDLFDKNFSDEFGNLIRLKHKNIVRFLGYCAESQGEMMKVGRQFVVAEEPRRLLCFEYVPNGNLQEYIKEKSYGFEWNMRFQIIKGICQGLHYLHQQRMNHLDLKPENVLLGAHLEPKITDFGMSRCFDGNISTMVTKNLFGTLGDIAPEFVEKGQISSKSDIYSFGLIMIKLLLGNSVINDNWQESLEGNCPQMKSCIEIAQHCIDEDPKNRPTICDIIDQLNGMETVIYNTPTIVPDEPRNEPNSSLYQLLRHNKPDHSLDHR